MSAVYLAIADSLSEREPELMDRLFRAVYCQPGLAVLAMAEPNLARKERARDEALGRVRDTLRTPLRALAPYLGELDRSLQDFLKTQNRISVESVHARILQDARACHVSVVSSRGSGLLKNQFLGQAQQCLRTRFAQGRAQSACRALVDARQVVASGLQSNSIAGLHHASVKIPGLMAGVVDNIILQAEDCERVCSGIRAHIVAGERRVNELRAQTSKGLEAFFRSPPYGTFDYFDEWARLVTRREVITYLQPVEEYWLGVARFARAMNDVDESCSRHHVETVR